MERKRESGDEERVGDKKRNQEDIDSLKMGEVVRVWRQGEKGQRRPSRLI